MLTGLANWWRNFWAAAKKHTAARRRMSSRYRLREFTTRAAAQAAAQSGSIVAVFQSHGKLKWAYFNCPCGCGNQIALNLMDTNYPAWRISCRTKKDFSIAPSVDSTTCGAHFWIRHGKVNWA
jgi:hypothetical protein